MTMISRREPIEWPDWFGRRMDDWWPELRMEPLLKGGVRVEEYREDETLVIRAELPGIDPEKDVEISIHGGMLHIKGERTEHEDERKKSYYRSEFRYGMFERSVPLSAGATEKDVKATYRDGILEVRVPMHSAEAVSSKVPVQRAD